MGKNKPVKDKIKEKAAAVKAKLKGAKPAAVKCCILAALSLALVGCLDTAPASRATTASYRIEVAVKVADGARGNTFNMPFTLGDGALASADSAGSTETQTATPTLDVKPDVNLNYAQGGGITNRGTGGAKASGAAGILESLTAEGLAALKDYVTGRKTGTVTLQKKDGSTVTADCKDGSCTFSDGTVVTAADCESCQAK